MNKRANRYSQLVANFNCQALADPWALQHLRIDTGKCARNLRETLLKEVGCLKIEHILWEEGRRISDGDRGRLSSVWPSWSSFRKADKRNSFMSC